MVSPRIRRLTQDYERLQARFADWPLIRLIGTAGLPPEFYRVAYSIRGLYVDPQGQILERNEHTLEINLSLGYPRRGPQCRMLTPVFHPNFDDVSVCIGDFWAPSERLDDLIVRIGRMIAYQEYNTKSPLNGLAARWAAENPRFLPIETRELAPPLLEKSEIERRMRDSAVAPAAPAEADAWPDKLVL
jgi:ubiquitin-protein ligase